MNARQTGLAYQQLIDGCFEPAIGAAGITDAVFEPWLAEAGRALTGLAAEHAAGNLAILDVANDIEAAVSEAEAAYHRLADGARTIVFFGTGGSSLGGQTIAQFGGWSIPGTMSREQRQRPMTRFYGNLDAATLAGTLDRPDLDQLRFFVEIEPNGDAEPIPQGRRDQARPGGRADQRKGLQIDPNRARRRPFPDDQIELEVLHGRIEDFLHRRVETVNLIDEQDVARLQVGQDGRQVAGPRDNGAGGRAKVHA